MPVPTDRSRLVCLSFICLMLAGCGPSSKVHLTGEVTFEGQLLPKGTIVFTPVDHSAGPSTGGDIVNGRYDIPSDVGVTPGTIYIVQITALGKSGNLIDNPFNPKGPKLELDANYLPASYNTNSKLKVKVIGGNNRIDFPLNKDGSVPADLAQE
jgi:hypothetical protein